MSDSGDLGPATEFEVVTALAFLYFAQVEVDYLVLEVGLGGVWMLPTWWKLPWYRLITNVSLEHVDILGDTVGKIAVEKAGIIKKGVPVLTASQDPEVLEVLQQKAKEYNLHYTRWAKTFPSSRESGT
jgi:dihydrofolate synthase / folylpolyglutamate synthase